MSDGSTVHRAPPQDGEADSLNMSVFARLLWRGRLIIGTAALVCGLAAAHYAYNVAVPTYRATTQMALIFGQTPNIDIETVMTGVSSDTASLNTEMEIIRSRELISRLVDTLDLTSDPEFNVLLQPDRGVGLSDLKLWLGGLVGLPAPAEAGLSETAVRTAVIGRVRNAISANIQRLTYVFTISATTQNPVKSALLTNTLARIYQDDQIAIKVKGTEAASTWLSARVSDLRKELETRQAEINARRSESALISPEALAALNTQSVELGSQLQAAELEMTRAGEALTRLRDSASEDVATRAQAANDPQLSSIAASASMGDAEAIQRFDRRFAQLIQQAESQRALADRRLQDLRAQTARLEGQFNTQANELIKIQQLERETEATRVLYETFLNRLRETSVQVGVQQADSRVLSEANRGVYVAPRKGSIILMGALLGALLASAWVLGRELMQNTFRTAEDLEQGTRMPVLGQIPELPSKSRRAAIDYLVNKPTSAGAEAVRNLRTSVLLSNLDRPPQVIMMTSSVPGEGKTTTAIALSQNLSGLGKRVLLIEGDIRRRTFGAYFEDARDSAGILTVIARLRKDADAQNDAALADGVHRAQDLGIDVLMGEKSSVNAADVFASEAFDQLMAAVRRRYDYVVIDTPPVLVVPDARVVGHFADAILYAVNWDATNRDQVAEGLRLIEMINLRVTGLVLTKIDPRGMKRYGYGTYGAVGEGYYEV